jgi:hypothetical protein
MKRVKLAILALLPALAACSGREPPIRFSNEASAISALRSLWSAQEIYKDRSGTYGDYFNLCGRKKYIDPVLAKADPDHPEHEDKSGYNVDISVNADNTDWCAIAYPARWFMDGSRNFKITSDGVIRYNETEGDTTNFPRVLGRD